VFNIHESDNEREFFIPLRDHCMVEGLAVEDYLDGRKYGFGEERLKLDFGDERFPVDVFLRGRV
jgi:hypothetical protein